MPFVSTPDIETDDVPAAPAALFVAPPAMPLMPYILANALPPAIAPFSRDNPKLPAESSK